MVEPLHEKEVGVQFYRLVPYFRDGPGKRKPVRWANVLRAKVEASEPVLTFEDKNKRSYTYNMRGESSVAIAKSVGDTRIQQVNSDAEIVPVHLDEVDTYLALVNHVYFYNDLNVLAILSGPPGVPALSAAVGLANHLQPLPDGGRWEGKALMSPGQLEKFEEQSRLQSVFFRADATPMDLLYEESNVANIGDFVTQLSTAIGSEITVELKVKVKRARENPHGTELLKSVTKLPKLLPGAKKLQATTVDSELLDLLEHKLGASMAVPLLEGGLDLNALVHAFENVCARWHDRIREALKASE